MCQIPFLPVNDDIIRVKGFFSIFGVGYKYVLDLKRTFSDYPMEAQANILADYYFLKFEGKEVCSQGIGGCGTLYEYEKVLKSFLENKSDSGNFIKPPSTDPTSAYRY